MQTAALRLHPMSLSEILDTTFALYRQNFSLFAGIVAVIALPEAILGAVSAALTPHTPYPTGAYVATLGVAAGGTGLIGLVFSTLVTGALAEAISARYLGERITVVESYRALGLGGFLRLLAASLLYPLIVAVGFALLVIPGIYLLIRFQFIAQAIVLDRTGVWGAFRRSGQLVSGSWWRVFGIFLVLIILVGILGLVIGGIVAAVVALLGIPSVIGAAARAAVAVFVQPIQLGALTLLYYDLRIRKEGFDLEYLARSRAVARP